MKIWKMNIKLKLNTMKTLKSRFGILLIIFISLIFNSCERWDTFGIKGQGPVVSETIELSEVSGIILEIPATVYLTQGEEQSISIDAQQNILDNIEAYNKSGALKLKFNRNVANCKPVKVYLTINSLDKIDVSGSGDIFSDTKFITTGYLSINVSGSGKVQLNADADEVDLNISGSGEIKLKSICNNLDGNISGSGEIYLEDGLATYADLKISGSGDIFAFNFPIEECYINTAGSGDTRLNVSDNLNVRIAGSGDVYYKGNPSISVNIAGSGSLINSN
jgi:hypothetical protein